MAKKKTTKKTTKRSPPKVTPKKKVAKKDLPKPVAEAEAKTKTLMRALTKPEKWLEVKAVASKQEAHDASGVLAWCKEHKAQCEIERKELVKPLQDVVKKINARFKAVTTPTDTIAHHVSSLLSSYDYKLRQAAEKKIEKEAAKAEAEGNTQFADDLRENAIRTKPDVPLQGLVARDYWEGEVVDLNAALVAFMEGNSLLQDAKAEILAVLEKYAGKAARVCKAEDIGIPGCKGSRKTTYAKA